MTKPSLEPAKGTKDWYGRETILRNQIRDTLTEVFERYGYDRLETPPIERREALGFKGGGEIQKEVFRLHDQGGRDLALRFVQTVPLSRYVASTPTLKFPFKRYAIGEVYRDGPTQPEQGRYRVFTQCDVDVLGVKEMTAEAELLALAQDAFKELGLGGVEVNINNRKLLDGILDYAKVSPEARQRTIGILDKMDKIGRDGVESELITLTLNDGETELSDGTLATLFTAYDNIGISAITEVSNAQRITQELGEQGYQSIKEIFSDKRINQSRSLLYGEVANFKTKGDILLELGSIEKIMNAISEADNETAFSRLEGLVKSPIGREGLSEIKTLLNYSDALGFDFIRFNPALARGLDYYTGTTIEVYLKDKTIISSAILAGGRFDNMVGDFRGGNQEIPAVGFSFGLERLSMILGEQQDTPETVRQIYVIPIGDTTDRCLKIAHELRNQGINVDMSLNTGGKVGKKIEYADKNNIPFVGFVGEDEIESGTIKIKNLQTGEQKNIPLLKVSDHLKPE